MSEKMTVPKWIFLFLIILMIALMMKNSQIAIDYINSGLNLCVNTIIPSLFPFMVAADMIARSEVGEQIARPLARIFRAIFGIGKSGSCALLLGWFCGLPVGSRVAMNYYENGKISAAELTHLVCFCNIPSTAFAVAAVGMSVFSSKRVGWLLFLSTILAAAVTGALLRFLLPGRKPGKTKKGEENPATEQVDTENNLPLSRYCGKVRFSLLSDSLRSATQSIFQICAAVLLFSALTGCLIPILKHFSVGKAGESLLLGLFEMTSGICSASAIPNAKQALYVCAAMMGWGGLSVHCQILSLCDKGNISLGWFWLARGLQSLGAVIWIWLFDLCGWISLPVSLSFSDLSVVKISQWFCFSSDVSFPFAIVVAVILLIVISIHPAGKQRHTRR